MRTKKTTEPRPLSNRKQYKEERERERERKERKEKRREEKKKKKKKPKQLKESNRRKGCDALRLSVVSICSRCGCRKSHSNALYKRLCWRVSSIYYQSTEAIDLFRSPTNSGIIMDSSSHSLLILPQLSLLVFVLLTLLDSWLFCGGVYRLFAPLFALTRAAVVQKCFRDLLFNQTCQYFFEFYRVAIHCWGFSTLISESVQDCLGIH